MMKIKILLRLVTLLLLMIVGVIGALGQGTVLYSQDYESGATTAGWTTSVAGRHDPVILEEGGNHFLAADPANTYNNGATVTGPNLGIAAGVNFVLTFDLRLGNSNSNSNNVPVFSINGANGEVLFRIRPQYSNGLHPWIVNDDTDNLISLPGTGYTNNAIISDRPWYRFRVTWNNGITLLKITDLANSTVIRNESEIPTLNTAGGIGNMIYVSANSLAKFAIDNILVEDGMCSYTVQSDAGTIFGQGAAFVGSTVSVPVPRFESRNNSLYEMVAFSSDYYHKVFTVTTDNQVETITYNYIVPNIFYYTEAEDIQGVRTGSGNSTRVSMGVHAYTNGNTDYQEVTTLPVGRYKITAYATNSNNASRTVNFKAGESVVYSFVKPTGVLSSFTSDEFNISSASTLYFASDGSSGSGVDNFYVQAILAFKEPKYSYISGSGTQDISQRLLNGTGATVTYSSSNNSIVSVDANGVLTLNDIGCVTITATAGGYTAKCLVIVRSTTSATATLTYDENTHIETMTISGTGNFDEEQKGGQRIIFSVGNPDEVQYVESFGGGLYGVDTNGYSHAYLQNSGTSGPPVMGTYFGFTPKYSGVLTMTAVIRAQNPVCLTNEEGVVLEYKSGLAIDQNQEFTFTTRLQAGETYYVYTATGAMTALTTQTGQTVPVNNNYPLFYLKSFSFDSTQSEEMTILVRDLLYPTVSGGINSANNRLDRAIPGFNLTFSGGDGATAYDSDHITFHQNSSGVGQLDITPRLLSGATSGDIVFTGVTLNYSTIAAGGATSVLVNGQTANMGVGSTSVDVTLNTASPTLTIRYGSETDDNSFVLTSLTLKYAIFGQGGLDEALDRSRTATQLSFDRSEFYVSNGFPKAQSGLFVTPSTPQAYINGDYFDGALSYSSADETVATVNGSNGTVTMLATGYGSETTISAQFLGSVYFLPSAVASYTVISSVQLTSANSYTIEHVKRGMVVEAVIGSNGATVLDFASTIATSQQVTDADGQLITTYAFDNNGSNDEFNVVISYVSGDNAYVYSARAYYKKPEVRLNYTPQAVYNHWTNWDTSWTRTGFVSGYDQKEHFQNNQDKDTCFDLEGEPTFTAVFEGKNLVNEFIGPSATAVYEKTGNIEFVTSPISTPKATVRSTGSGETITDATVSVPVSLRSTALGYDPSDANNAAVAQLPVIPFPYTWDLTSGTFASKTKALELVNVTDDGNGYVLLGPSSVAVHGIAIVAGRERPKTNYEIDPTLPNSRLRIPVMEGMKVSVTCYGAERRVTGNGYPLQISNVTDLRGYATATMEILTESNTQDFLAKDNGYVEIYNRSDVNVYIQSITVSAPELIFADGTTPKVSRTATYENRVLNIPTEATITFSDSDGSNAKIASRTNGTYTFWPTATGNVVVTVTTTTEHPAHGIEPCWGQYTLSIENFYFNPNTITLYHSQSSVSYHANVFLAYAKLYLNDTEWNTLDDEEKAKISFSVAAPAYIDGDTSRPNYAKGIVTEQSDINDPYIMEVRNDGQLVITAVYRDVAGAVSTVKTSCTVNIVQTSYSGFKYPAPTVAATETSYTFAADDSANPLDAITRSQVTSYKCTYIGKEALQSRTETNLGGSTTLTLDESGVYHVEAFNGDTRLADFYLTKAYRVDQTHSQSWDFRNGVSSEWGTSWSQPKDPTNGNNVAPGTPGAVPYFQYATWTWTRGMPTNRASDYRCVNAVNGNNGFIVKETSGLLVIADAPTCARTIIDGYHCDGHFSAYTGDRYNYVYPNIGLHRATLIIPSLPKGAYVAVAWDRTSEGDGNTMVLENLLDLEGKTIDEIRYGGSVRLTGTNAGNQQGYYTFRVANDGNVTFTQNDKGTSRIVAIHVYYGNPDTNVDASDDVYYNLNATEEYKGSGMTQKLMAYARANADGTADVGSGLMQLDGILTIEGETTSQWLTNYLNFSAPNGVAEFKMVNQDVTLHNMSMDMSQTYFDSGNGTYAVPGFSFVGACWGKAIMSVGVRDGNGYLVAYRQYRFTVGIKPKMQYPKTWDFTRYFDNVTAKIEDSPVTLQPETVNLNTKNSLADNTEYPKTTISVENGVIDTAPTRTWDIGNSLMRKSGTESYLQYGYNEYSSYYVDDAVLVCNLGRRNDDGFVIEETRGLGFNIAPSSDTDTSKKLQWVMPSGTVGYGENCNLMLNGTMTIAAVGEEYKGYYVFLRSSRPPDAYSDNLKVVNSGDYNRIVSNDGQYVFEVTSKEDMTLTFNSDTEIYGIGVTNIKKDAIHPVGTVGWATESRDVDIDYTLTGYYTNHHLRTYEVQYDSYDMNTATVKLSEIKNTAEQLYDSDTNSSGDNMYFMDHGYIPKDKGVILAEFNVTGTDSYKVPLFVPAITTTHDAVISDNNMMRPNLVRRQFNSEEEGADTRFLLTNVHWTFTKGGNLEAEEAESAKITETDAAGFYRQHLWTEQSNTDNAAKNTMVPNTAYMLVPTSQLPVAVWKNSGSSAPVMNTIGIRFDDTTGVKAINVSNDNNQVNSYGSDSWYTLNGVKLSGKPKAPGIYIHGGRKVVF